MEFQGDFELEDVSPEQAWLVLSDPIAIQNGLRGLRYIAPIEDGFDYDAYEPEEDVPTLPEADPDVVAARAFEEGKDYAAVLEVGVGSVKPRFEAKGTIDEREFPRMVVTGSGAASDSQFSVESGMEIVETDDGARIEWWADADVSGRIAQLGGRVLDPVADKLVNRFFSNIESQMREVEEADEDGITDRLRNLL